MSQVGLIPLPIHPSSEGEAFSRLYLLGLVVLVALAAPNVAILVGSLRGGDRDWVWVSAAHLGATSLLVSYFFWRLV